MPSSRSGNGTSTPSAVTKKRQKLNTFVDRLNMAAVRILAESCLVIYVLQFIANVAVPDHNADAFRTVVAPPLNQVDHYVRRLFEGFTRWDSQHFLHLSLYGYTFENNLAFFPFLPFLMVNFSSFLAYFLGSHLSTYTLLVLSGVSVNFVAFSAAGYFLYSLTRLYFDDVEIALKTVALFAINPASIFFRTIYTESWFAFFTFLGLHCLRSATAEKPAPIVQASICFALSCVVRSNGLLNFGYVLFACFVFSIDPIFVPKNSKRWIRYANGMIKYGFVLLICAVIMFLPFCLLQFYQYVSFCTPDSAKMIVDQRVYALGSSNSYVFPGEVRKMAWCHQKLPLPYSAVQAKYWDVGFARYYQWRKIPNFLLALPTFVIAASACLHYLTELRLASRSGWTRRVLSMDSMAPYVAHVMILLIVGLFFINVEVTTRMLYSSTPVLIWYACGFLNSTGLAAHVYQNRSISLVGSMLCQLWRSSDWRGKLVLAHFCIYLIAGTALHVNFLPWT